VFNAGATGDNAESLQRVLAAWLEGKHAVSSTFAWVLCFVLTQPAAAGCRQ
jgi:hypothetical protein